MFCAVSKFQTLPENLDKLIQVYNEQAIPAVLPQRGFKGTYLLTKPSGDCMILSIWDTEEQANAWPQNPEHKRAGEKLGPLISSTPVREGYELGAHAVA